MLPADLPETAALLHDVDKAPPLRALRAALGHGTAGASWLAGRGFAELGPAIAGHPADPAGRRGRVQPLAARGIAHRTDRFATPTNGQRRKSSRCPPLRKMGDQPPRARRHHRPRQSPRRASRRGGMRRSRHHAGRSNSPALGRRAPAVTSGLAYFWGADAFELEQAARRLAADISAESGQPAEIWRTGTADDETGGAAAARARTDRTDRRARRYQPALWRRHCRGCTPTGHAHRRVDGSPTCPCAIAAGRTGQCAVLHRSARRRQQGFARRQRAAA